MTFTEDNFYRTMTNLVVTSRSICREGNIITKADERRVIEVTEEAREMAYLLEANFFEQFKHDSKYRSICPNPDCKGIYAYFYSDWSYCPKCGTKLIFTLDKEKIQNGL